MGCTSLWMKVPGSVILQVTVNKQLHFFFFSFSPYPLLPLPFPFPLHSPLANPRPVLAASFELPLTLQHNIYNGSKERPPTGTCEQSRTQEGQGNE